MAEVRHDGHRLARGHDFLEQAQQVVGIGVADEALRPVGQRLRAEPDGLQRRYPQQWLHVGAQALGRHDHRIATGHQDVGDLGMLAEVADERVGGLRREAQIGIPDELCPAEAVGAVRVTGLPLGREVQHGLLVLVLHALQRILLQPRHVEFLLAGGVRVEGVADRGDTRGAPGLAGVGDQIARLLLVGPAEHARLREHQLEDRVVRHRRPVDELVEHVLVGPEGEHGGVDGDGLALLLAQAVPPGDGVEMVRPEGVIARDLQHGHLPDPGRTARGLRHRGVVHSSTVTIV